MASRRKLCTVSRHLTAASRQSPGDVIDKFVGPDYPPAAETQPIHAAQRGKLHELTMYSEDSSIYPGVDRKESDPGVDPEIYDERFRGLGCTPESFGYPEFTKRGHKGQGHPMNATAATPDLYKPENVPYKRGVTVYIPPDISSEPAPFIVVHDGLGYVEVMSSCLDNLIAAGRVPSNLVAIFADSGGSDAQGSQRGLEYDTMDGKLAEFFDTEVVPFCELHCGVQLSKDPNQRAAMGGSSGGCAAFTMAWFRPDLFRRVLTYSGTFVNQQYPFNPKYPTGCWEYHGGYVSSSPGLIARTPPKPLRVCLFNTELDIGYDLPGEKTWHNWTEANTRMATILKTKGYKCRHVFCRDAGHVDRRAVAHTLADGLAWLWSQHE